MRSTRLAAALALALLAPALARAQGQPAQPEIPKTSDKAMLDRARVLKRPAYPTDAADAGTVAVRVLVSPDGEVISARAVAGPEDLRPAAAEAARGWEFASSDSPDNESGYLLFRFATASDYASIVGVRDDDVADAAEAPKPTPATAPKPAPTPAPAPAPAVQKLAAGDLLLRARRKVPPQYPPTARASRIEGLVVVELEVDETGRVVSARPLSGHALLRDAAVAAARQWTFAPTVVGGTAVKVVGTLSFNFKL